MPPMPLHRRKGRLLEAGLILLLSLGLWTKTWQSQPASIDSSNLHESISGVINATGESISGVINATGESISGVVNFLHDFPLDQTLDRLGSCDTPVLCAIISVAVLVISSTVFVFLPCFCVLFLYWRTLFFFWLGGTYDDSRRRIPGLSKLGRAHLYSLASVPWLMKQPHYRCGTFQEDMLTNLRNVVLPTGLYGFPLSIWARSRLHAIVASLVLIPFAAFVGSLYRRFFGLEGSVVACFRRTLLEPKDWLQLWRLNCRLASMTALATQSKDFELEDKWVFIQGCQANGIPVTPVFDKPVTLIAKDVKEEGGMGIHVLKNVMHGGRWILQEKLENSDYVNKLLPKNAPLSTLRVVTGSRGALKVLGASPPAKGSKAHALCTVWRAGRQGASTDHSCVMVDVPKDDDILGRGSNSAQWYARGLKSLGMPLSRADGELSAHPDTGVELCGQKLRGVAEAAALCERAHDTLMPTVPLAGWDVAFCAPSEKGGFFRATSEEQELVLVEANLSCNFFRGSVDWEDYASLLDEHFSAIDNWRRAVNVWERAVSR